MDVCVFDLVDVQGLIKYNDGINFLLSFIDDFSKYLHVMTEIKDGALSHVSISIGS